jgi:hypothetical protein
MIEFEFLNGYLFFVSHFGGGNEVQFYVWIALVEIFNLRVVNTAKTCQNEVIRDEKCSIGSIFCFISRILKNNPPYKTIRKSLIIFFQY